VSDLKFSPIAYLDIVRHIQRFNHEGTPDAEKRLVYGLLIGHVEENAPLITKFIPILHTPSPLDFETNHQFFQIADKYQDDVIGWARSYPSDNLTISPIDKKNLLYFQTAYSEASVMLAFDSTGDQYSMLVKHFKGPLPELDESSELEDMAWNFSDIEDLDDIFKVVFNIQQNREEKKPLIKELNEK
jgi:hypothetical protein